MHPYLDHGDGGWHAFWGATLDASVQAALAEIAAALPPVAADAFDGDRDTMVHDLYPVVVDQIARDRLRADRVGLVGRLSNRPFGARALRRGACGRRIAPPGALRLCGVEAAAVTLGLRRSRRTRARLRRCVEAQPPSRRAHGRRRQELVLELWLQAEDDPSLSLPASLVWDDGDGIFSFLRASDPRKDFIRRLAEIEPFLAEHGIEFDGAEATEAKLDVDTAGRLPARGDAEARGAGRAGAPAERMGPHAEAAREPRRRRAATRPSVRAGCCRPRS